MTMDGGDIAAVVGAIVVGVTLPFIAIQARAAARAARREAVEKVLDQWYSFDMSESRTYLNGQFSETDWPAMLNRWPLTVREMIGQLAPENRQKLGRLVSFLDRVGWLAADRVFPAEWFLLPMQHLVKKTYIMLLPFLLETRHTSRVRADPLYGGGIDALYAFASVRSQGARTAGITERLRIPQGVYRPAASDARYHEELQQIAKQLVENLPEGAKPSISEALKGWHVTAEVTQP